MTKHSETCAEVLSSLPLLVGGDLEKEVASVLEAHVAVCASCSAAWERAHTARAALEILRPATGMPDLWPGVRAALLTQGSIAGLAPELSATGGRGAIGREAAAISSSPPLHLRALRLVTPFLAVAAAVAFLVVLRDGNEAAPDGPPLSAPIVEREAPPADPLIATPAVADESFFSGLRRVGLDEPRLIETLEDQPVLGPVFLGPGARQLGPLYDRPAGLQPAGNFR